MCDFHIATAQKTEKIKYLEKWIDKNIDNKEIWAALDLMEIIKPEYNQNPITFWKKVNIDWNYLGLAGHGVSINHAQIRFYRLGKQNENYTQSNNIMAIGFGIGYRNRIVIKVGSSEIPDAAIFTERELRYTTKISDNVLVICTSD